MNIAINGFGRIGRQAFKAGWGRKNFHIVAINDLTDTKTLAHLLQYDTAYHKWSHEVTADEKNIIVDGTKIPVYASKDPSVLPWKDLNVDVVIESTGKFTSEEGAKTHITAGAKKVVISAPAKGGNVPTYVLGVNEEELKNEKAVVINNASCTTNSLAPVMAVLNEEFGVVKSMMTTVHGYTNDQNLQDGPHKDLRRARAAAENIVPTTTGAAIAVAEVLPDLQGKFDGIALRVPVPVVSLSDITAILSKPTTAEEINAALTEASKSERLKGILAVTNEPLVSSDFVGNPASGIVDLSLTKVLGGDMAKVVVWYDNEMGYSQRLVEIVEKFGA
ncbi:MAG: type I glyceraldehyde-3-phosphate dehydrogenase [Candidatus Magasanikbacteria bacterium]|nr:type I glyceraldehyde-3-phosphate dehydrogenase [Candidatus Magasanikbacteria bacterium]